MMSFSHKKDVIFGQHQKQIFSLSYFIRALASIEISIEVQKKNLPAVTPSTRLSALWSTTSAIKSAPTLRFTLNKDIISFLRKENNKIYDIV
jgi:hypothetical protein